MLAACQVIVATQNGSTKLSMKRGCKQRIIGSSRSIAIDYCCAIFLLDFALMRKRPLLPCRRLSRTMGDAPMSLCGAQLSEILVAGSQAPDFAL